MIAAVSVTASLLFSAPAFSGAQFNDTVAGVRPYTTVNLVYVNTTSNNNPCGQQTFVIDTTESGAKYSYAALLAAIVSNKTVTFELRNNCTSIPGIGIKLQSVTINNF